MITRRTKIQLLIFALITAVGVTFVGFRYAKLDEAILPQRFSSYTVVAHYPESGGIFVGGEVTYRGVRVGQVTGMELTDTGVDVELQIDNEWDKIPADVRALVGNRSAVGEQYVELQPKVDPGKGVEYLEHGDEISDVATPIATEKLLGDVSTTVGSIDQEALRTTVHELGVAFGGTGEDLQQIIDTSNSFIQTADDNFEITTALIEDANVVLHGQIDSESALQQFATNLQQFSEALANSDKDLRTVIDNGSSAANELRTFIEQNDVELESLLNNVITTGEVVVAHFPGIEQYLTIFPYIIEGSFTVVEENDEGVNDAHFGLVLTSKVACEKGYLPRSSRRDPIHEREDIPMDTTVGCREAPTQSNARGYQNLQRASVSYDPISGEVTWDDQPPPADATVATPSRGEDSLQWLLLQPLLAAE